MAYSNVNRMDPVKNALVIKKQQSMSNYKYIVLSSRAPVLLCSEQLQDETDRSLCYLSALRRCGSSEIHYHKSHYYCALEAVEKPEHVK